MATTITIDQPFSIWVQLASLCFTLGGLFGDLLIIRLFLFGAYLCLLLQTVLGGPLWPNAVGEDPSLLRLDALLWAVLNLYLHGSSLVVLLLDEAKVKLTDDEAALWRLFYRTGGISERIFYEVMVVNGDLQIVEYDSGTSLPTDNYFYILYQGSVTMHIQDPHGESIERQVAKGEMFDFKHLGMLSKSKYFQETYIRCETKTKAKLFRFSKESMTRIANHPLSKVVWQSLLINNLSQVVASSRRRSRVVNQERAMDEDDINNGDIFAPLADWEVPDKTKAGSGYTLRNPLLHMWLSMRQSFFYPWPCGRSTPGIRQTQLAAPASTLTSSSSKDTIRAST